MQSREKSVLTLVYARLRAERRVLLGLKKRGFGQGKFNGFGGKLEREEGVTDSAARELLEESGLRATPADLHWRGVLTYIYDTKPKAMEVNVYDLDRWEGEPVETEEMKPVWFCHEDIPLQDMWADDSYWLLQYLDGDLQTPFRGRFRFKGHEGPDSWVVLEHAVASFAPTLRCSPQDPGLVAGGPGAAMVVSTVSFRSAPGGQARPLESFVRFHLAKGFARIMIVVDDPGDAATLDAVRRFPSTRISVRIRGEALLEEQRRRCASFADLEPLLGSDVSARQMLDAELAMALAPEAGCSWVVCLDSDELFYTREDSVVPHFESLDAAGVDQMTYLNHEGVPEAADTDDYFATVTLFRRHHFAVPLTEEARGGLRYWMSRSRRGQYLLFYDNGKSACRAGLGARPRSQHAWRLPEGRCSRTALADPRNFDVEGYRECGDPCILHFPVCGLGWLAGKYQTLGSFPDAWLGKLQVPESFHKDAREAGRSGQGALSDLFHQEVLLADPREVGRQLACGSCFRSEAHALLLDAVPATPAVKEGVPRAPAAAAEEAPAGAAREAPMSSELQGIERGWVLSKAMGYL